MFPPMDYQKDAANRPVFLDISWFEFLLVLLGINVC
jgi:hypothetical protein